MTWWNKNSQPQQNTGALPLGMPNGQQQMPAQGAYGAAAAYGGGYQNPYAPPPPPTEMDIISTLISTNPAIERWLSAPENLQTLISLLSSIVTVSVHQMLSQAVLKESDSGYRFDFSAMAGLPTPDTVSMAQTQILNASSNTVQQQQMQVQQMVAIANQGAIQGMLDAAMADPGMLQVAGQAGGSFLRGLATGGR